MIRCGHRRKRILACGGMVKTSTREPGSSRSTGQGFLVERGGAAGVSDIGRGILEEISIQGRGRPRPLERPPVSASAEICRPAARLRSGGHDRDRCVRRGTGSLPAVRRLRRSSSWVVEVRDRALSIIRNGSVKFLANGSPAPGFNTFHILIWHRTTHRPR